MSADLGRRLARLQRFPFCPKDPAGRTRVAHVLAGGEGDDERDALEDALATEFLRLYAEYRREVGAPTDIGTLASKKWQGLARVAGVLCARAGIEPSALIAHVHGWITCDGWSPGRKGLAAAPLNMLASGAVIDGAVLSTLGGGDKTAGARNSPPRRVGAPKVDARHGFADAGSLNPGIRPALESAGFDLAAMELPGGERGWTDAHLLSVQAAGRTLLAGGDPPAGSKMRAMAEVAAAVLAFDEED